MKLARLLGIGLSIATLSMPASRAFAADEAKPAKPATGGGRIGTMVAERIRGLTTQLDLNNDQKKKVDDIVVEAQKKAEDIQITPEGREQVRTLSNDTIKKVKAILTEEQIKKLDGLMKAQPGEANRVAGGPTALVQLLQTAVKGLDLNEKQKTKMTASFAEAQKKADEIRAEIQSGKTTPETREKLRSIFDSLRGDMEKILTPEQQEKLREAMQNRATQPPASGKKDL